MMSNVRVFSYTSMFCLCLQCFQRPTLAAKRSNEAHHYTTAFVLYANKFEKLKESYGF